MTEDTGWVLFKAKLNVCVMFLLAFWKFSLTADTEEHISGRGLEKSIKLLINLINL